MIQPGKQRRVVRLFALCAAVLLITLFFGLKPKGYRFINQVRWFENSNDIAFTNIGMVYSKKVLGEIGISDSMSIIMAIKPYRTGRILSRIIAIVNDDGNDLFTVDQWMKGIEITLWDGNGKRVKKAGIGEALSADSFRLLTIGINDREMWLITGDSLISKAQRAIRFPPGHFNNGRIILGLSANGRNPWRGEMAGLGLFGRVVNEDVVTTFIKKWRGKSSFKSLADEKPEALFYFNERSGRTVADQSGNRWDLDIPVLPKMFKYEVLEILPDLSGLDKSLLSDLTINLLGFIPFGGCFYLLFSSLLNSRKKSLFLTIAAALGISISIELFQVFIPTRTSQLIDVILNGAGAWAGAQVIQLQFVRCKVNSSFLKKM